jgi:hypothetical protein
MHKGNTSGEGGALFEERLEREGEEGTISKRV